MGEEDGGVVSNWSVNFEWRNGARQKRDMNHVNINKRDNNNYHHVKPLLPFCVCFALLPLYLLYSMSLFSLPLCLSCDFSACHFPFPTVDTIFGSVYVCDFGFSNSNSDNYFMWIPFFSFIYWQLEIVTIIVDIKR